MKKIINLTSLLIICFLFANANASWFDKAIEEGKKISKDVYEKSKEQVNKSTDGESQEQNKTEQVSSSTNQTSLKDCPHDFSGFVPCGTAQDMIGTRMSMDHGKVSIVKKGVLQCIPRGCDNVEKIIQLNNEKNNQQTKAEPKPSSTKASKQSKSTVDNSSNEASSNQADTEVLSLQDLDESTPTGKALTTVHTLLTPSDGGIGTAAQVMARVEARGYQRNGTTWSMAELREHGGGRINLHCGRNERNECDQDSEVTTISYSLRVSRGGNYEELYGDLIPTSIAFMRGRLGKETYSKNMSEQSGHLQWNPSPKLSHVEYVSFTIGRGSILLKINKVYGQT